MSTQYQVISGTNDRDLEAQINDLARVGYEIDKFASSMSMGPTPVIMHTVIMTRKRYVR